MNDTNRTMTHFKGLLMFSGLFNIIMASPLILPSTSQWYFQFLWRVNEVLRLGGVQPSPPVEGINALLVNTAGIDLVLIGSIVVYSSFDPMNRIAIPLLNAVGRIAFAGIVLSYFFSHDIMRLVLVIGFVDVCISAGFIYYAVKLRHSWAAGSATMGE